MLMPQNLYVFRFRIERIIDGDTFEVQIDQGMNSRRIEQLRLLQVNCPEPRGESVVAGKAATAWVTDWLQARETVKWPFIAQTKKIDNFYRWLSHVWCADTGEYLNSAIIAAGHGEFDGKTY